MTLYAYCNSSLIDHSVNVLKRFENTFIKRGDTRVICKKITLQYATGNREYSKLVDICINLTRLGVVLHDIGKGMTPYQDPGLYEIVDGGCRASYPFHEVFSSIIIYRLAKRYLTRYISVKQFLSIPVIIALYHHYTMERLNPHRIIEYVSERFNGKIIPHPELKEVLLDLSLRVLEDMGIEFNENIVRKRKILDPIRTNDITTVFHYIREKYSENKRVFILAMGLVGQAAVIDYIVASLERGGKSKYLENLCGEAEWLCENKQ